MSRKKTLGVRHDNLSDIFFVLNIPHCCVSCPPPPRLKPGRALLFRELCLMGELPLDFGKASRRSDVRPHTILTVDGHREASE